MLSGEILIVAGFGLCLFTFTLVTQWRKELTVEELFAAGRDVGIIYGTMSIMATWTAATAILVAGQVTYQMGLAGLFWFTLPNALGLVLFAPVALKIRRMLPDGFTIAQLFDSGDKTLYLFVTIFSFVRSFLPFVTAVVGGSALLTRFSNFSTLTATVLVVGVILSYSLVSGLSASILTDVIQMTILGILILVFFPWTISIAGGFSALLDIISIPQIKGVFIPPGLYFGIVFTVVVFSVPFTGQFLWQRVYAIEEQSVKHSFVTAGVLFLIIPLLSSMMGLIATMTGMTVNRPILVSYLVLEQYLPMSATVIAFLIVLTALLSTADSALVGCASILVMDVMNELLDVDHNLTDQTLLRISMIILSMVVLASIYLPFSFLDWVLFHAPIGVIFGVAVLSRIFESKVSRPVGARTIFVSSVICFPVYIYATLKGNDLFRILALGIGLLIMILPFCYGKFFDNKMPVAE